MEIAADLGFIRAVHVLWPFGLPLIGFATSRAVCRPLMLRTDSALPPINLVIGANPQAARAVEYWRRAARFWPHACARVGVLEIGEERRSLPGLPRSNFRLASRDLSAAFQLR